MPVGVPRRRHAQRPVVRDPVQVLAVGVDEVELLVAVRGAHGERDAAGGHPRLTGRPLHDLVRRPVDRHAEVVVRRVRHAEAAALLDLAVDHVVQLEQEHVSVSGALHLARDEPDRAQPVPEGVVHALAQERRGKRVHDLEAVGVVQVPADDRLHLRRDPRSAEPSGEGLERQRRRIRGLVDQAQRDAGDRVALPCPRRGMAAPRQHTSARSAPRHTPPVPQGARFHRIVAVSLFGGAPCGAGTPLLPPLGLNLNWMGSWSHGSSSGSGPKRPFPAQSTAPRASKSNCGVAGFLDEIEVVHRPVAADDEVHRGLPAALPRPSEASLDLADDVVVVGRVVAAYALETDVDALRRSPWPSPRGVSTAAAFRLLRLLGAARLGGSLGFGRLRRLGLGLLLDDRLGLLGLGRSRLRLRPLDHQLLLRCLRLGRLDRRRRRDQVDLVGHELEGRPRLHRAPQHQRQDHHVHGDGAEQRTPVEGPVAPHGGLSAPRRARPPATTSPRSARAWR